MEQNKASDDGPATNEPRTRQAQPPALPEPLEIGHRETSASGLPAVVQTMRFGLTEMGPARTVRTLLTLNQKGGTDCPSCAWPDPDDHRSPAEFCENGAKAVAEEATRARVTPEFFARYTIDELAGHSDMWLGKQGRLTCPMVLRRGKDRYEPISWEDAFILIASELNALASPNEATFYTSGRTSNEAAFLYQLFVRQFGTNNLPDCSNMCHESSGLGLNRSIGIGKGTVKLEDFHHADAIFVFGQNPGTNHPRMLTALQAAARRGCRIVSVNPLAETGLIRFRHPQELSGLIGKGTPIASLFLPVRINGDVALLKGMMKSLLEREPRLGGPDRTFIAEHTEGFDAFAEDLARTEWEEIVSASGLRRELIEEAADIVAGADRLISCWAMGLTQHKNGVANVQSVVNLHLLRGQIGKRGAGLCPVRGHSNVQGDRTMGIWERVPEWFRQALGREFGFDPPREHGLDAVDSIRAMHAGKVRVFFALGGNFLSAMPDTEFTAEAMRRARLTVHVSTKLHRGHLITGEQALILPCLGRTERDLQATGEQFVTVEDSMGVVHSSRGNLEPASPHLLSEPAIVAGLARATLGERSRIRWEELVADYDRIRDHVSRVVPGFDDYNRRVREPGGFYLPNGPRDGEFPTDIGKARFTVHSIPHHSLAPDQLLLMTIRSHDQFNTTIYGPDDRYRGIYGGRRVLFMNADDLADRGLTSGDRVDITSHFRGEERQALGFTVVAYEIPRQCAAAYFPETNVLVPMDSVADGSNQPASKSIVISVRAAT
ncbi:MAG: FdhF/YdeP family oxidoreductase [Capsulimonadales bacterium]|nr:FdhF/YdeP family oxidoreductase [Capsulimonadales bacterium]